MQTFIMTCVFVFGILAVLKSIRKQRIRQCKRAIADHGVETAATILDIERLPQEQSGPTAKIRLRLQVEPKRNRNYVIELERWAKESELVAFRIGTRVSVKCDPAKPKRVILL